MESFKRILILCVDRDDDIGVKTGIKTPIVGRDVNVRAASELAVEDPEEADANSMFAAVKLYDTLSERGSEELYEVATIAGSKNGGVEADRKILKELSEVLKQFPADGVIMVSDGYADERIIPIIQSKVPVISVRHVVVRHSESVEETWAVLSRYLKLIVENKRYARLVLGIPGILLVGFTILWQLGQLKNAGAAFAMAIGILMLVKGFGIDEKISSIKLPDTLEGQVKLVSKFVAAGIICTGLYMGSIAVKAAVLSRIPPFTPSLVYWLSLVPYLVGVFVVSSVDLITIGVCLSLLGGVVYYFIKRDSRFWRNVATIIVAVWVRFILMDSFKLLISPVSSVTPLIVVIGVGSVVVSVTVWLLYHKVRRMVGWGLEEGQVE